MNYYNPYFFNAPSSLSALSTTPRVGLLTRLFGRSGITLGGILNGTQRALSFANQAIPFVKQVKPMIGNAKTMFRIMNEFKKSEKPVSIKNNINSHVNYNNNYKYDTDIKQNNYIESDEGPTFFI